MPLAQDASIWGLMSRVFFWDGCTTMGYHEALCQVRFTLVQPRLPWTPTLVDEQTDLAYIYIHIRKKQPAKPQDCFEVSSTNAPMASAKCGTSMSHPHDDGGAVPHSYIYNRTMRGSFYIAPLIESSECDWITATEIVHLRYIVFYKLLSSVASRTTITCEADG